MSDITIFIIPEIIVTDKNFILFTVIAIILIAIGAFLFFVISDHIAHAKHKEDEKRFVAPIGTVICYWNSKGEYRKSKIKSVTVTETRRRSEADFFSEQNIRHDKRTEIRLDNDDTIRPDQIEKIETND